MVAPFRAALLPGYAKLASDGAHLRAGFSTTFEIIVMVALPIAVAIGLLADPLVADRVGGAMAGRHSGSQGARDLWRH